MPDRSALGVWRELRWNLERSEAVSAAAAAAAADDDVDDVDDLEYWLQISSDSVPVSWKRTTEAILWMKMAR